MPRTLRPALTTLGVVLSIAVVAVASRGSLPTGEPGGPRPAEAALDVLFTLYVLLLVAGAAFFVYLVALQRGLRRTAGIEGGHLSTIVFAFILLVGLAGFRSVLDARLPEERSEEVDFVAPDLARPLPEQTPTLPADAHTSEFAWVPVLAFVGLLLLTAAAIWWASRRRRQARPLVEYPTLGTELAEVLEQTLDDLRAERDPRRAVIGAYARLERVLAAHGVPRRASDTPLEYLRRVLADVSVSREAAERLTLLFEQAKFSQHDVGPEMKEEAIEALQTMQDALLAAEALAQQERERAARAMLERQRAAVR